MSKLYLVASLFFIIIKSFAETRLTLGYPRTRNLQNFQDNGEPLILTPYIKAGKIDEAQSLARVYNMRFGSVTSYSGYFNVNERFNSNLFFWYFRAANNPENAPVILWLQGGPGASSLYGLFFENGPFRFRGAHTKSRPYSWHKIGHLIYVDNPVGTGFSFTNGGYAQNETAVGNDLYNLLLQFYEMFPNLQKNELFVTGESYAGKYVPAVCHAIHTNNKNAQLKMNLKGFAIGNGLCDPLNQLKYSDYLYQIGLVDENGMQQIKMYENKGINFIKNQKWEEAYNIFDTLINGDSFKYGSLFYNLTGYNYYFNFLHTNNTENEAQFDKVINSNDVRKSLHVGNTTFSDGVEVQNNLKLDMMQSVADWIVELLSVYRGLFYNGQLDIIIAYPLTENFLKNLKFSAAGEYKNAIRHKWFVNNEIAGYMKSAGNLTEVLVRNTGHMVPSGEPRWAFDLITKFINNNLL